MAIHFNSTYLKGFLADHELSALSGAVKAAHQSLTDHTGLGNDFLGWVDLPTNYDKEEFARIQQAAEKSGSRPISSSLSASAAPTWGPGRPSSC